jgi:hypothetical protein
MTWFKVDDALAFHAKTVAAGNPAMGLWVRAGAWSSAQGTDGLIPHHMIATLGSKQQAKSLVMVGLWLEDEAGYRFHQWDHYQPSAAEVRAEKAAEHERKAAAGRAGGIASGVARRKHAGSRTEADSEAEPKQNEAPTRPDPTESPSDSDRFDEFWDIYPRRVGRGQAVKAWKTATRKAEADVILTAAAVFAESVRDKDPTYIAHPTTWLNGERWLDAPVTVLHPSGPQDPRHTRLRGVRL